MQQESGDNRILAELKQLYRKVSNTILRRRLGAYHSVTTDNGVVDSLSSLDDHITRLCDQFAPAVPPGAVPKATPHNHENHHLPPPPEDHAYQELSNHFRNQFSSSSQQPHLSDKLRDSSWQHINMALSYARHGDRENAKMHSELARNAVKMAASYMDKEEYQTFIASIETSLKSFNKEDT